MLTNWKKNVVRLAFLLAVLFIAMPLAVSRAEEDHGSLGMARITYIQGDALFNSPDTDEWAALSPNFTLRDEDRLWAGEDSKMEVTFADGHVAWVNDNSELDMVRLSRNPAGNVYQVALREGEASFSVPKPRYEGSVFQVDLPDVSIRATRAHSRRCARVFVRTAASSLIALNSPGRIEQIVHSSLFASRPLRTAFSLYQAPGLILLNSGARPSLFTTLLSANSRAHHARWK